MGKLLNSMEWYYLAEEKDAFPSLSFKGRSKEDFERWHSELKTKLLELLGKFPEKVSLELDEFGEEDCGDFIREKYTIASEKNIHLPLLEIKLSPFLINT